MKILRFKTSVTLVLVLFLCVSFSGIAQNCNAELSVVKNRNYKSVGNQGAFYVLQIENNSLSANTYTINFKDVRESCANSRKKVNKPNVPMKASIITDWSTRSLASNNIKVPAGQKMTFKVLVKSPEGTPYDSWGCVKVIATTTKCKSTKLETILSAYVVDISETE